MSWRSPAHEFVVVQNSLITHCSALKDALHSHGYWFETDTGEPEETRAHLQHELASVTGKVVCAHALRTRCASVMFCPRHFCPVRSAVRDMLSTLRAFVCSNASLQDLYSPPDE